MIELVSKASWLRHFLWAVFLGIILSFAIGFVENKLEPTILEVRRYGYPLAWRLIWFLQEPPATDYLFTNLVLDIVFWVVVSLLALAVLLRVVLPNLGMDASGN